MTLNAVAKALNRIADAMEARNKLIAKDSEVMRALGDAARGYLNPPKIPCEKHMIIDCEDCGSR